MKDSMQDIIQYIQYFNNVKNRELRFLRTSITSLRSFLRLAYSLKVYLSRTKSETSFRTKFTTDSRHGHPTIALTTCTRKYYVYIAIHTSISSQHSLPSDKIENQLLKARICVNIFICTPNQFLAQSQPREQATIIAIDLQTILGVGIGSALGNCQHILHCSGDVW